MTRLRPIRTALLSATMLATGLAGHAEAAMYGVVVNQVNDPLLTGLSIPASAPTAGMFSPVQNWPMNAITLGLLPSGKVVSFGAPGGNPSVQDGRTFDIWDPAAGFSGNGHTTLQGVVGVNSFCASQAFMADGSLLVAGGIFDNGNDKGSVVLNNQASAVTALAQKFANDRYYATMLTLQDGRQLIMGGSYPYNGGYADPQGSINNGYMTGMTPEVYGGGQWSSLFGANSRDAFGPDNNRWWYPRAWVAPNGKVFGISADKMWMLDASGKGSVSTWAFKQGQRAANSATDAPNVGPTSTAVMYDTGKFLQVGGNSFDNYNGFLASSLASTVDVTGGTPVVTDTAPMQFGRAWAQSTVLPTGQVAVSGGSLNNNQDGANAVLQTETWDPKTGKWSAGASGAIYRGYHSTAILMQNGAILIAGGGAPGPVNNQNAEVYYPSYLFTSSGGTATLAPRPQIVSLSALTANYGQSLQFELNSQNGLSQVVLVGLSQVTHSFNSTQRRYAATFTQSGHGVSVQMPASGAVAPPGYYQLIAIDSKGVPSPGVIVGIGGVSAPVQAKTLVAAAGTGTAGSGGTGGTGTGTAGGTGGTGGGTTAGGGTAGTGSTAGTNPVGTPVSLQGSNYTANYLTNVNGTVRLVAPANTADRQQSTFRLVPGLAGQGVSFQSSTTPGQYLRHANFQIFQQASDGGTTFKNGSTFLQGSSLSGTCGCNSGLCASYQSIDWPGYYLRHQNFNLYMQKPDGSDIFKQDASFCVAPPQDGSTVALQGSNYPANYLTNVNGAVRLAAPQSTADRQQATLRLVPGLAGKGVSFQSSTATGQYFRHANFQIFQQATDGGNIFLQGSTFTPSNALAGTCGCNSGMCVSYQSVDWPGYYLRHQNFNLYMQKPDGSDIFKQDASFCVAPGLQ